MTLAVDGPADLHFGASVDAYQQVPRYRYAINGERVDNITDWALEQFRTHYQKVTPAITKDAIFHYVYGVLHDPVYREKYALNLKREFPRIPFYPDFWRWADWGEALMKLHIGYESVERWPLQRIDTLDEKSRKASLSPKAMLRANKEAGVIQLDTETQLTGVPAEAWSYKLGKRSALEWILDQYKEKTAKDPTIREQVQHLLLRGPQGEGDRSCHARDARECRDNGDRGCHAERAAVREVRRGGGIAPATWMAVPGSAFCAVRAVIGVTKPGHDVGDVRAPT